LLGNLEKAEERRRLRKVRWRREGGEEGVGYDSFLAIEIHPEPSILK
jgi:hypothetical protein